MSAMVTSWRVLQRFVFLSSTCLVACVADMTASFSQGGFLRVRFSPCTKKRARMNSFAYGPANTHQRHARQLPRRAAILCLFHPDCNRWSRILTGSAKRTKRGGRLICSGRGLPAWRARLLVTASGESHPALKQNSSCPYCMREGDRLQPLLGSFWKREVIGRFETGGPHVPCRENGSLKEKAPPSQP